MVVKRIALGKDKTVTNSEFNPDTNKVQQSFKGLKIYSRIGVGGQKIVYRAEHPKHGKVALKLIKPGSVKDRERIRREIYGSTKLRGTGFSKIYEFGDTIIDSEVVLFIFEELLEGQSLRDKLVADKKLPLKDTLRIAEALLKILVEVDKAGIVHRDIKPENIFITKDNRIVLIDFGIARHLALVSITHDDALFGPLTPGYAAPEQIKNEKRKISSRTDIFSFGTVIYECLIGCNPFTEGCGDGREALDKGLNYNPKPLSAFGFTKTISDFVETCLQKHPNRRYSNPLEALKIIPKLQEEVK